jgi:ribosomal protein L35AE/L33A
MEQFPDKFITKIYQVNSQNLAGNFYLKILFWKENFAGKLFTRKRIGQPNC